MEASLAKQHPRTVTPGKRTIFRYQNRKLYDLATGGYVGFPELFACVMTDEAFEVIDSVNSNDLTTQVLCSLIFHLSRRGMPMREDMLIDVLKAAGQDATAL